jgi:hypothetical protein
MLIYEIANNARTQITLCAGKTQRFWIYFFAGTRRASSQNRERACSGEPPLSFSPLEAEGRKKQAMSHPISAQTLQEMVRYYRERAREYDQWFYRQVRFDQGAENNARWFAEA